MISKEALDEFKIIWKQEIGEEISDEKATEEAANLLTLFNVIYRPIKKDWLKEFENNLAEKSKMKKEAAKFLKGEILGNPSLSSQEIKDVDDALAKILRESNEQTRKELQNFLKRWEIRTLFVDALHEAKEEASGSENGIRQG